MFVQVQFKRNGKNYYFHANNLNLNINDPVIVETDKGTQYGIISGYLDIEKSEKHNITKKVIRVATLDDKNKLNQILKSNKDVLANVRNLVKTANLNMFIISAEYTFNKEQLMIKFLSDKKIDFRDLVKEIAKKYKTRIELRQIGVRDKSQEIGGYGICGCELCCHKLQLQPESISINMAKNQSLALNPNKINGMCGRLMCCLKYEDDTYSEIKKNLPSVGTKIETNKGLATVINVDIFNNKVMTKLPNNEIIEVKYNE